MIHSVLLGQANSHDPNARSSDPLDQVEPLRALELDIGVAQIREDLQGPGRETCLDCGKPIPEARRKAYPSATLCVGCKQLQETGR